MTSENYLSQTRELAGVPVNVTSYKIGDRFYCHVSSVDPGATIARVEAASSAAAETLALGKAAARLSGKRG
ncbi:hypothetical protein EDS67_06260 [candidate division KSB1 bacterium]|nr:MAG: hypothetical protein EDS67_06260 [candidate division KSB1 bacterium]MBC6947706.1 hypothetical protein [candidate division KSB1 bacterium]MCE7940255.1 hypothetical protein [Chlorobi bacterium CHB1]